jgi:hypothetical protein
LQEIIDESGLKEMVSDIKENFKKEAQEVIEDFKDWDNTLNDGLEDEEWDEDHALDQVMNAMVEDFTEEEIQDIMDEEPSVESIESEESIEDNVGLVGLGARPEKRRIKNISSKPRVKNVDNSKAQEPLKKGPLYSFRTNRSV